MSEELLGVGERAPSFEAESSDGGRVRLDELLAAGPVLLMFYPADETPGCTKQMCLARDEGAAYREAGVARFGINPDSLESHRSFAANHELDFPLLVDEGGRIATEFGVPRVEGYVSRATFLIGSDGRILFAQPGRHGADAVLGALGG
jgi:thioredoxin-dependent peroxiredoxin